MGVEMEGGKPGWYDALNGLPGLLGSSMAESCELARLLAFTADALEQEPGTLVPVYGNCRSADGIGADSDGNRRQLHPLGLNERGWKEHYRASVWDGFVGSKTSVSRAEVAAALRQMEQAVARELKRRSALGRRFSPPILPSGRSVCGKPQTASCLWS